jgi:hypothetical protein
MTTDRSAGHTTAGVTQHDGATAHLGYRSDDPQQLGPVPASGDETAGEVLPTGY